MLAMECSVGGDPGPTLRLNLQRMAEAAELEPQISRYGYFFNLGAEVEVQWYALETDLSELD